MKKVVEPYILAFDMDGTLLDSKKKISRKTARFLRKLAKKGHHIIISSGRPPRSIKQYYEQLKLDTPVVAYNGELVYSPVDENFKEVRRTIPKEVVLEVLDKVGKNVRNIMCEGETDVWIDQEDTYLGNFFWYKGMDVHHGDLHDTLDKDTMTCLIHCPEEYRNANEIEKICEKWPDILPIFWIGKPYFELHHKTASKGDGLRIVAEHYKIPKERIIAFGDATNDIEMFEFAKTSVLMSNAKYDLKDKVTMVSVKDNDHDGIYYTLKQILKK